MQILHIAGYKFVNLTEIESLRERLLEQCLHYSLSGTILIGMEGVNINLAGQVTQVSAFKNDLKNMPLFSDISFRESYSDNIPFKRLKVNIKQEIITFKQDHIQPTQKRTPTISPKQLKKWLDNKHDMILLDTRNDYEVRFGTFKNAMHLAIQDFSDLAEKSNQIPSKKPIVMFCTGGIRCEKAGLYLQEQGHAEVFQLDGGILNYFNEVGGEHYEGECFVFDERIALDATLKSTGTKQCSTCGGPIPFSSNHCSTCFESSNLSRNL